MLTFCHPFNRNLFSNAENYQFKLEGLEVNNGEECSYEAHVFQMPWDVLEINDNNVDKATSNERAKLFAQGYKACTVRGTDRHTSEAAHSAPQQKSTPPPLAARRSECGGDDQPRSQKVDVNLNRTSLWR